MTTRAAGWVDGIEAIGGELVVSLTITDLAGEVHRGVRAGTFSPDASRADVTAALIAAMRSLAESDMGVKFGDDDDVRLWTTTGVA